MQHLDFDLRRLPVWSQFLDKLQSTGSVVALVNRHIYFGNSRSLIGNMYVVGHGPLYFLEVLEHVDLVSNVRGSKMRNV